MALSPNPAAIVRPVTADDVVYEQHLARRFTDQLGFLPLPALEWYADQGCVYRCHENDDPAGFAVMRRDYSHDARLAGIIQAAIDTSAQRRHLGLALVHTIARDATAAGKSILQCWCAADLESNAFWGAAGFSCVGSRVGGRSRGRRLNLWRLALDPAAQDAALTASIDPRNRAPGGRFAPRPQPQLRLFDDQPGPQLRRW